jgi:hypothetical protein
MTGEQLQKECMAKSNITRYRLGISRTSWDAKLTARPVLWFFVMPRRLPFTMLLLLALMVTGVLTGNTTAKLSPLWYHHLGFSPRDLWNLEWHRLVTSTLATEGGPTFWRPLVFAALVVGAAEWFFGTRRAFTAFWVIDLVVLAVEAVLIGLSAHLLNHPMALAMASARDVGPSAGLFGVLGLLSGTLPKPWRWISGAAVFLALLLALFASPGPGAATALEATAELAHVIAFPLGWVLAAFWRFRYDKASTGEQCQSDE